MSVICLRPLREAAKSDPVLFHYFGGLGNLFFYLCAPLQYCFNLWGRMIPQQRLSCRAVSSSGLLAVLAAASGLAHELCWSTLWSCSPQSPFPAHHTGAPLLFLAAASSQCERQLTRGWCSSSTCAFSKQIFKL